MGRAIAIVVFAVSACPSPLWAQSTAAQEAIPSTENVRPTEPQSAPRLSRARILTGAGLVIGGTAILAAAENDRTLPRDDRRLLQVLGVGSLAAGGLTLALPSRARTAPADEELEPAPESDRPSRRKLWTGIGLTLGGAVLLVQSVAFFPDGCRPYEDECRGWQNAFRFAGGTLTATGVGLIILDRVEQRRGARVALGIAPGALRVNVSF